MVGVVNQKWRDTMALLGGNFTKEEHTAGWPESFKPERIAVLQRPFKWWPAKDKEHEKAALCNAYKDGLNAALASGELAGTTKTMQVTIGNARKFEGFDYVHRNSHGEREPKPIYSSIPKYGEKQVIHITAPAFAAWLAAQGEAPSVHIQAWFDAVGVAGAVQVAPVTFTSPIDETAEEKELRWLNHLEAEQKTQPRGALARSAKHFGIERSTFGYATKRAKDARAMRYRADIKAVPKKGTASVFDGLVTTVRDGKKAKAK